MAIRQRSRNVAFSIAVAFFFVLAALPFSALPAYAAGGPGGGGAASLASNAVSQAEDDIPEEDAAEYNADDIEAINNIIEENGLGWTKAEPADGSYIPEGWEGVLWSGDETDMRAVSLEISGQSVTGVLDASSLPHLSSLYVSGTRITGLDLDGLASLEVLYCNNNLLAELDLYGLSSLETLYCDGNMLTELSLYGLSSLRRLDCDSNLLTELNVGGLASLTSINCAYNRLTGVDLSLQNSISYFHGIGQTPFLTLAGSGGIYSVNVSMGTGTTLGNGALTYFGGTLTSRDNTVTGCAFTSPTGKSGMSVTGTVYLGYPDAPPTYNPGDVAAINALIKNNGMAGTVANPANGLYIPYDWWGINWSDDTANKRIVSLYVMGTSSESPAFGRADMSGLDALRVLYCDNNELTGLDVSGLASLEWLECGDNELAELDVIGLASLERLGCDNNHLTALDMAGLDGGISFNGSGQTASLTLYRDSGESGGSASYSCKAAMGDNSYFGNYALSYGEGRLTSASDEVTSSMFRSPTGLAGKELEGVLSLEYAEKLVPTIDDLDFQLEAVPGYANVYNGKAQPISSCAAASGVTGLGKITVYYQAYYGEDAYEAEKSTRPPTSAGIYKVSVDIAEGESYTAVEGITLGIYEIIKAGLSGTLVIDGTAKYGETLTVTTAGLYAVPTVALGAISYQWIRGNGDNSGDLVEIPGARSRSYTLTEADIGHVMYVLVEAANCDSMYLSDSSAKVAKASGPAAPALEYAVSDGGFPKTVTITAVEGAEYSFDGGLNYSESNAHTSAKAETVGLAIRVKATATHDPSAAATATVRMSDGVGDNDGKQTATPGAVGTDIANASVTVAGPAAWTGKQAKPKATVKLGGKTLVAGKDYTVSYGANKNIGKGSVTVKGAGAYTGAKTAAFKILPQKVKLSKTKAAKGQIKATWKKAKAAQKLTGYQLRYRASQGKAWGQWKTKTATAKKTALTIKGLKKGKKYQVQIRGYKKLGKEMYSSAWSAVRRSGPVR